MGINISSPAGGRGTACTSPSAGAGTTSSIGSVMPRSTGCGTTCSIGSGTAAWIPSDTTTFSGLQRHSASSYSVDASVGHTSAVTNGDVGSLSQTGAVVYSGTDSTLGLSLESTETLFMASDSEEHTTAVS
jgi:hypothetical protein